MAIVNLNALSGKNPQAVVQTLINPGMIEKVKAELQRNPEVMRKIQALAGKIKQNPAMANSVMQMAAPTEELGNDYLQKLKNTILKSANQANEIEGQEASLKDKVMYGLGSAFKLGGLGGAYTTAALSIAVVVFPRVFGVNLDSTNAGEYLSDVIRISFSGAGAILGAAILMGIGEVLQKGKTLIKTNTGQANLTTESLLRKIIREELAKIIKR